MDSTGQTSEIPHKKENQQISNLQGLLQQTEATIKSCSNKTIEDSLIDIQLLSRDSQNMQIGEGTVTGIRFFFFLFVTVIRLKEFILYMLVYEKYNVNHFLTAKTFRTNGCALNFCRITVLWFDL